VCFSGTVRMTAQMFHVKRRKRSKEGLDRGNGTRKDERSCQDDGAHLGKGEGQRDKGPGQLHSDALSIKDVVADLPNSR